MDIGLLRDYIICSCYKTQISHIKPKSFNKKRVYACHCSQCIKDNLNNVGIKNGDCPLIWTNIIAYNIINEFNDDNHETNTKNGISKLNWKRTGYLSKRGYCKHCNDPLILDFFFNSKYICNINAIPHADLYCKNKDKQLTTVNFNSMFCLKFHHLKEA